MKNKARLFTLTIALIATSGSLYFSEIKNYIPCELCWYQRILMYPLVVIVGVSIITKDNVANKYILPLSITGTVLALYHYIIQNTLILPSFCDLESSCTIMYINWLGFITIPFLSFIAFFGISAITLLFNNKNEINTNKKQN